MITEWKKDEIPNQQTAEEPGSVSATAQNILGNSAQAYGQTQQVVSDVHDKTTEKVNDTYDYPWESLDPSLFSRYFW